MAKKFLKNMDMGPRQVDSRRTNLLEQADIKDVLIIDEGFKNLLPGLEEVNLESLTENIRANGCRTPLDVWSTSHNILTDGKDDTDSPAYVLIDGHNRYQICQHYKIDFKINLHYFDSREEVNLWMINHQLSRRNLTNEQSAYLIGLRAAALDAEKRGQRMTMEQLAEQYNTTRMTVYRNKQFAAGVNKLPDEVKSEVLSGKSKATFNEIRSIGNNQDLKQIKSKAEFDQFIDKSKPQTVPTRNGKKKSILEPISNSASEPVKEPASVGEVRSEPAIPVVLPVEGAIEHEDSPVTTPLADGIEDNPVYQQLQTLAALIQNPKTCTKENLLKIGQIIPEIVSLLPA